MKIILVNYRYFISSGAETFLFKFKALLEKHGHTVIPFSTQNKLNLETPYAPYFAKSRSKDGEVLYSNISKTPGNIYRMLAGAFYNPDAEKCLRRLIRAEKPDLVFVLQQMNALSPSVFRAAKKEGVPVIHRLSDFNMICPRYDCLRDGAPCTDCIRGRYLPALRHRCVKGSLSATLVRCASMRFHRLFRLYRNISRFVVPSAFTAGLMRQAGVPAEKIVCLPTFIDSAAISPAFGGGEYFLFMGRLSPEKGITPLIRAMSLTKHPDARLVLAGNHTGGDLEAWKEQARALGLGDRVEFRGFQRGEALEKTVRGAIAVVLPVLWYENMPNAVLESFAYGKPVISSDIGSIPDVVTDGETGLLCPPGDPRAIAEAMDRLLDEPEAAERMGRAARRRCEEAYAPESYYSRMTALFEDVLSESGKQRKERA